MAMAAQAQGGWVSESSSPLASLPYPHRSLKQPRGSTVPCWEAWGDSSLQAKLLFQMPEGEFWAEPGCPSLGSLSSSPGEGRGVAQGFRDAATLYTEAEEAPAGWPGSQNLPHLPLGPVSSPALSSVLPQQTPWHPGCWPRKQGRRGGTVHFKD